MITAKQILVSEYKADNSFDDISLNRLFIVLLVATANLLSKLF